MNSKEQSITITVLRWLAVVPGAILFPILIDFPIHWLVQLKFYFLPPDEPHLFGFVYFDNPAEFEYLMYAFFNPLAMILAVAYITPHKKLIASVIASVLCVGFIAISYYSVIASDVGIGFKDIFVKSILNIAGLTLALIYAYRKNITQEIIDSSRKLRRKQATST